jgi:hypothetical protein
MTMSHDLDIETFMHSMYIPGGLSTASLRVVDIQLDSETPAKLEQPQRFSVSPAITM